MNPGMETTLVEVTAGIAAPILLIGPFDMWWLVFIPLGLLAGWLARAARMVERDETWGAVKRDLLVSMLAGASNGILAAMLIWLGSLNYLQGIGAACVCAFLGTGALERAVQWTLRKLVGEIGRNVE